MKQVSIEAAFGWARAFGEREWRLLAPVALAFLGLPGLLFDILLPDAVRTLTQISVAPQPADQGVALLGLSLTLIVNMAGWLALAGLALLPGISVREAIMLGLRRLPALLGAYLLWCAALLLLMVALAMLLIGARVDRTAMQAVMVVVMLVAGGALWVRLLALLPARMATVAGGPVHGLRGAWQLSRGAFWPLLGTLLVYMAAGVVLLVALSSAGNVVLTLIASALGLGEAAKVLLAVFVRALGAIISLGLQLLAAALFRQLAAVRAA